jgi:hypothetical protein
LEMLDVDDSEDKDGVRRDGCRRQSHR